MSKPKVATTSLAGCFGCHMSLLDIDERILKLIELVDFDKSPIDAPSGLLRAVAATKKTFACFRISASTAIS